jgi:hypothetical protein
MSNGPTFSYTSTVEEVATAFSDESEAKMVRFSPLGSIFRPNFSQSWSPTILSTLQQHLIRDWMVSILVGIDVRQALHQQLFSLGVDKPRAYLDNSVVANRNVAWHSSDPVRAYSYRHRAAYSLLTDQATAKKLWNITEKLIGYLLIHASTQIVMRSVYTISRNSRYL